MKEERFLFSNCTLLNNELFLVESQSGLPAKMSPDIGNVTYYDIMEGFFLKPGDVIDLIQTFENKVYALETSGDNLIIFDINKNQCQYIALNCNHRPWQNFAAFERYESDYYIFPTYGNKIYVMNTDNNEITEIADYFENIDEIQCGCRGENKVWLLSEGVGKIGAYDLSNRKMKVYELGEILENCMDAVFADGNIYILNRFGIIYRWNINNEELQKITILETEHVENESMYRIVYAGNKLIIFPSLGNDIKILDLLTRRVKLYDGYPTDFLYHKIGWSKYQGFCEDSNHYYFAMRLGNYLLKICKNDGKLSWIKPFLPSEEEKRKIELPLKEERVKKFLVEGKTFFNEGNVDIISLARAAQGDRCIKCESCIGSAIYKTLR